jgi:hypothetical protein
MDPRRRFGRLTAGAAAALALALTLGAAGTPAANAIAPRASEAKLPFVVMNAAACAQSAK